MKASLRTLMKASLRTPKRRTPRKRTPRRTTSTKSFSNFPTLTPLILPDFYTVCDIPELENKHGTAILN
jgi:hypothetical protein